jgi:hypothetical protein
MIWLGGWKQREWQTRLGWLSNGAARPRVPARGTAGRPESYSKNEKQIAHPYLRGLQVQPAPAFAKAARDRVRDDNRWRARFRRRHPYGLDVTGDR